jgi:hypothetical protein
MLKRRHILEIVFWSFLASYLTAMGFIFSSDQPFPYNNDKTKGHEVENKPFWQKIFPDSISFFNFSLVLITGGLAVIGITQADAAKKSAEVAEQALYGTEAPFIFIIIDATDGNAIVTITSPQGVEYPEHVSYMFHNYGRSPAIIREIYIACIASDVMPSPCPFPPLQSNLFQSEIVGPGDSSESKPLPQIASFLPNKSHPWAAVIVYGHVRYADVFGNQYLSGFCYAFNSYFNRFHAIGGAIHNYRRKLNEDENREAEKRDIFPF